MTKPATRGSVKSAEKTGRVVKKRQIKAPAPASHETNPAGNGTTRHSVRICVNEDDLYELTENTYAALVRTNQDNGIVVYGGKLARVRSVPTQHGSRSEIELYDADSLRERCARVAYWHITVKAGKKSVDKPVSPPVKIMRNLQARSEWGRFPKLYGLSDTPILHDDGAIHTARGLDTKSGLWYTGSAGEVFAVPARPTATDIKNARNCIGEVLYDFPYADDEGASRANAFAAICTAVLHTIINGPTPMFTINKPDPGTGAGLLAEVLCLLETGRVMEPQALPEREEEIEKRLTAICASGATIAVWDNIKHKIQSPSFAKLLTSREHQGRLLGRSQQVIYPHNVFWIATANHIRIDREYARRTFWSYLDAKQPNPAERDPSTFRHPRLVEYVQEQRAAILAAVYTLARGWIQAKRPLPEDVPHMGGFEEWRNMIGGILQVAGVTGFLGNRRALDALDDAAKDWDDFLTALYQFFGERSFSTADVAGCILNMQNMNLHDALPSELADHLDKAGFSRRLGHALKAYVGSWHAGYVLEEVPGGDRHLNVSLWRVRRQVPKDEKSRKPAKNPAA